MKLNCVLIEEDNRSDFDNVFPDAIELTDARVAVAAVDDEEEVILGAVSYKVVGYEYVIDWLFVEPQVRRQGVGTYLINEVLRAVAQSGELLPVTASFEIGEEDDGLRAFFVSCELLTTSYSHERYYVSPEEMKGSDALHKSAKTEHKIVNFFDQSEREQKIILSLLSKQQLYTVHNYEEWRKECAPELCQCSYVNDNPAELIFMKKLSNGNLELAYLYGKEPKGLIELLGSTLSKMEALFPGASLTFDAVNDESMQLAKHLFPKAKTAKVYVAEF